MAVAADAAVPVNSAASYITVRGPNPLNPPNPPVKVHKCPNLPLAKSEVLFAKQVVQQLGNGPGYRSSKPHQHAHKGCGMTSNAETVAGADCLWDELAEKHNSSGTECKCHSYIDKAIKTQRQRHASCRRHRGAQLGEMLAVAFWHGWMMTIVCRIRTANWWPSCKAAVQCSIHAKHLPQPTGSHKCFRLTQRVGDDQSC